MGIISKLYKFVFKEANKVTIFLDIDGVLHGGFEGKLDKLPIILRLLDRFSNLDVVISSDWRRGKSILEIRGIFPLKYRHRIIGMTPEISHSKRWKEIEEYISRNNVKYSLVIDDMEHLFRGSEHLNLYITKTEIGLTEYDESNIRDEIFRLTYFHK